MTHIRPEQPADYDGIHRVNCHAFGRELEGRLVDALRRRLDFIPALSLVALRDDRLVGHILFGPLTIEAPGRTTPAIFLAPLVVEPGWQRVGIGSALVRAGLDRARRLHHSRVIVIGHASYYPRFGFVPARPFGLDVPFPCPDEAFMLLELTPGAMRGMHGMVCYPPEFAET